MRAMLGLSALEWDSATDTIGCYEHTWAQNLAL